MSVLPAREGQAEVIEPVIQRHTGDADAVIAHVGEIRKPHPARRVLLPEDDVLLGPVQCPPGTDAPLQRAANTDADLGMATPNLVGNRYRPQAWGALQQRHDLAVPNLSQRIATAAATRRFLLRQQPRILFDTISGGGAEPGFGRGNGRRLGLAETHIQPHLAVGDVAAGQAAVPHRREEPASYRPTATAKKHGPLQSRAGRQIREVGRGYALPFVTPPATVLILIDARFSSCSPRSTIPRIIARWLNRHASHPDVSPLFRPSLKINMVSGISAYETEMAGCCMVTVGASPVANVTANEPVMLPR